MSAKTIQPNNTAKVNYIIYENNDTALLLNCVVRKNNKTYSSNIPIELIRFSKLIKEDLKYSNSLSIIAENLFNSEFPINQVSPLKILKMEMYFNLNKLLIEYTPLRISA